MFLFGPNLELIDVIPGGGKQSSTLNMEDSVESGENAAVNNIYQGNYAGTYYALDSQMIVTEGRKLSFLVVDCPLRIYS